MHIDEVEIQAREDQTVLQAALEHGIHIPTLCYHPDLSPYGACRLCQVEIRRNGSSTVTTSCNLPVEEGMIIQTDTPAGLSAEEDTGAEEQLRTLGGYGADMDIIVASVKAYLSAINKMLVASGRYGAPERSSTEKISQM